MGIGVTQLRVHPHPPLSRGQALTLPLRGRGFCSQPRKSYLIQTNSGNNYFAIVLDAAPGDWTLSGQWVTFGALPRRWPGARQAGTKDGYILPMGKERIERMFASVRERERPGLIVFLTAGFPDMDATLELVPALVAAGADAVELGVPFSDPLAEGPTIQQSSFLALRNGVTTADCLQAAGMLRDRIPDAPLILMGYYNPIYAYGVAPLRRRVPARRGWTA